MMIRLNGAATSHHPGATMELLPAMRTGLLILGVFALLGRIQAAEPAERFFEQRVRPVLAEHCFGCHGPQKQKGGLRLDSAANVKAGSDSGAGGRPRRSRQEPARPGDSLRRRHQDAAQGQVAERVHRGAYSLGARSAPPGRQRLQRNTKELCGRGAGKQHWAFQPVRQAAASQGARTRLGPNAGRSLHPGQARSEGVDAVAARRQADAAPPR